MSENAYDMQSTYQEEPMKPQIDMLPCRTSSNPWFYAMIVCFFVNYIFTKILLHQLHEVESNPFNDTDGLLAIDTFLSPLLAIPGIVFIFLFANGCKNLIHNEYRYAIAFVCLSVIMEIISFIGDVTDMNPEIPLVMMAFLAISGLVMAVLLTRSFVNNYSGELHYLGICMRNALKFTFIVLGIVIVGCMLFLFTDSFGIRMTIFIVTCCLAFYTLYLIYLALRQMNWILEAGHDAHFTDYDLEGYLNGYAPNGSNGSSLQRKKDSKVYSNKNRNKSKDATKLSVPTKIMIGVSSLIVLAVFAYLVNNHFKEGTNDRLEQIMIDEDYEDKDIYDRENEDIASNLKGKDADVDSPILEEFHIPDWIPANIGKDLMAYCYAPTRLNDNNSISGNYKGFINEYPITMKLSIHADGSVTGKYAYDSTLRKYGDINSSWFRINGVVLESELMGLRRIVFRSYAPGSGNVFEYWDLNVGTEMEGYMFNVKYIENPVDKMYEVHLQMQE